MTSVYSTSNQASLAMPNAAFAELMKAVLAKGAPFRFQAPGFSMTPFIRNGDVITIVPSSDRIRLGDVVAFQNPAIGKLTIHRVVHISRRGYLFKGDNSPESDGRVSPARIIGRVVRVERHDKRVQLGSGIERVVIAFLSRHGWLTPIVRMGWRFARLFVSRTS